LCCLWLLLLEDELDEEEELEELDDEEELELDDEELELLEELEGSGCFLCLLRCLLLRCGLLLELDEEEELELLEELSLLLAEEDQLNLDELELDDEELEDDECEDLDCECDLLLLLLRLRLIFLLLALRELLLERCLLLLDRLMLLILTSALFNAFSKPATFCSPFGSAFALDKAFLKLAMMAGFLSESFCTCFCTCFCISFWTFSLAIWMVCASELLLVTGCTNGTLLEGGGTFSKISDLFTAFSSSLPWLLF